MKAIAQASPDLVFIVTTSGDHARIVDMDRQTVSQEHHVESIMARGYWGEVVDTKSAEMAERLANSFVATAKRYASTNKEFEEGEHPRDSHGRFTDGAGGDEDVGGGDEGDRDQMDREGRERAHQDAVDVTKIDWDAANRAMELYIKAEKENPSTVASKPLVDEIIGRIDRHQWPTGVGKSELPILAQGAEGLSKLPAQKPKKPKKPRKPPASQTAAAASFNLPSVKRPSGRSMRRFRSMHLRWSSSKSVVDDDLDDEYAIKVGLPLLFQDAGPAMATCVASVVEGLTRKPQDQEMLSAICRNVDEAVVCINEAGLYCERRDGMSIEELRRALSVGHPAICCIQAKGKDHSVVAVGFDAERFWFVDPCIENEWGWIASADLADLWHGGDGSEGLGVVVWPPDLHPATRIKAFEEDKHPRDDRGRWASGAGESTESESDAKASDTSAVSVKSGNYQDGVRHRIMLDGKQIGHINGLEGSGEILWPDGETSRGKVFDITNTEISDEEHRGKGYYQKAVQDVANIHGIVRIEKFQASAALQKSIRKMPGHTESKGSLFVFKEGTEHKDDVEFFFRHETAAEWRERMRMRAFGASEFDEDKHPRDSHGRWSSGGSDSSTTSEAHGKVLGRASIQEGLKETEESMGKAWQESTGGKTVPEFEADIAKDTPAGVKLAVHTVAKPDADDKKADPATASFSSKIISHGTPIGDFDGSISAKGWSSVDLVKLEDGFQGRGIIKPMLRNFVDEAQSAGGQGVTLLANISIGGYAWAKFGFVPDDEAWRRVRNQIFDRLDAMDPHPKSFEKIRQACASDDPRSIWKIADNKEPLKEGVRTKPGVTNGTIGQYLLCGRSWDGHLNFDDEDAMARFRKYTGGK